MCFFFLLHANRVVVFHIFLAVEIGVMALSAAVTVILGASIPQVETKMAPMTMTVATTNETCHSAPSTLPSNPCPREGKGKDDEGEGDSCRHGRQG